MRHSVSAPTAMSRCTGNALDCPF